MYWYLVINFGVFPELAMMHWSFEAQQMLNVLVILGVHTLYIVRICKLEAVAGIVYGRYHFRPILLSAGIALCVAYATALESCYEISTLKIFASAFESGHLVRATLFTPVELCFD
ncbi:hypothetical protein EVJ58_g2529 [Rhodofomes roseus]|uniref:Uncharacterized protein n=1 Tax=Rhodofomes roseus TaxID=34475 RepID=A0A4Y9YSB6_9APHY|nr:hypothetical protein EVJ58_g2529 [Rhodofomes roseus]